MRATAQRVAECLHIILQCAWPAAGGHCLLSMPTRDGECSQLLCWSLVPCPNSCAHFISDTDSAGLEASVLQGKFLCVKYRECWCGAGQCVSYLSCCCRNVSPWQSSLRKERFTRALPVTVNHGREGTEPEATGLVASTVRKQRYMVVLSSPSPFTQHRTPDRGMVPLRVRVFHLR